MPPILLRGRVVGKWKKKNSDLICTLFEKISSKDQKVIRSTAEKLWDTISKVTFE